MNSFSLSIAYLRHNLLASLLNILTFTLGVALIVALLLINSQLQNEFSKNLRGIDLVVGAKGSPIQLILSSVFHIDIPSGNIPLEEADKLSKNSLVKEAIPLAMGDNYLGFRIVGTTELYPKHYQAELAQGNYWQQPMQAVLGVDVAAKTSLKIGEQFVGSHGLGAGGEAHEAFPYKVVGILQPTGTVIDRLVLTSVESVWQIHEQKGERKNPHERQITSLLLSFKTPSALVTLPREVNSTTSMQAASPAFEVVRLTSLMGVGSDAMEAVGALLMILAGLGIFVNLYKAMNERKYDMALMRSFGASPIKLYALVLSESMIIAGISIVLGLALGHGLVELIATWIMNSKHIHITGEIFLPEEGWLIAVGLAIGFFAALLPAFRVYKIDIFKTLVQR